MTKEEKNKLTRDVLRHWYENHQEDYCNFTDLMHDRRGIGFEQVFNTAITLVPKYEKALLLYLKNDHSEGIEDLERILTDGGLKDQLSLHFKAQMPDCIVPAMLSWLFFGRSFECMVEFGEELIQNGNLNFLLRRLAPFNIKTVISRSIAIGARKEEDWVKFVDELESIGITPIVTAGIVSKFKSVSDETTATMKTVSEKKVIPGKAKKRRSLEQLLPNCDEYLLESIDEHINIKQSGRDIALLYLVLDKNRTLVSTSVVEFHAALEQRYAGKENISIPGHRGIQENLKMFLSENHMTKKGERVVCQTYERPEHIRDFNDLKDKLGIQDYAYSN
ncbi:MAG: DUF6043 family protein [Muribaculaceae bacterium]|nr:DUF6043 family protein [Muribaculaceae bacterium]